jgi:glycosyltransferase EpsF
MAVVEAQAAELPCVIASTIPEEIDVVPALIHRVSLDAPRTVWAERILDAARRSRPSPHVALQAIRSSDFEITKSLRCLLQVYDNEF